MTRWLTWLIALTVVMALLLRDPMLALVALLLVLLGGLAALWDRYALAGMVYERKLGANRLFVGEETDLTIQITNAKPLPLAWLKVEDELPVEVPLTRGRIHRSYKPNRRMLTNTLSLRFYERVRKQYHLKAAKRGAFALGPVELQSGDLFGLRRHQRVLEQLDELVVYPLVVPIAAFDVATSYPFGEQSALRRLVDDPLRIATTRPYVPGDNPRYLHWKATAHRGSLQTKTFDPSAALRTAIFLDIQTVRGTPAIVDSYLEYGIIAAASVARHLLDRGEAVGLYVNAPRRHSTQRIRLAPSRHPEQWQAILEALARTLDLPSLPFERFLRGEQAGLPYGVPVLAITAIPGPPIYAALLDLQHAGHPTALVAVGDVPPPDVPGPLSCAWIGGEAAYARLAASVQPAEGGQTSDQSEQAPIRLEFGV